MPDIPQPDIGAQLGPYRLEQLLGEGGMGRVFLAEHAKLGRRVAIKMLKPEFAYNPTAVRRFFDEARVVNRINHEHIVEIEDFVDGEGSEKYLVMELLKGQTLAQLQTALSVVPLDRGLAIMVQVAETLAAVHEASVVHRDLKPDNIFLMTRGGSSDFVKLLDFGVAKLSDGPDARAAGSTAAGTLLGTPEYMAPEQLAGKSVDARADIYSLGIILFELMAGGRRPFEAKSFGEMVIQHLTVPPPNPREFSRNGELPGPFVDLILQCLEKDPLKRPASMYEVHGRLQAIVGAVKEKGPSTVQAAPGPKPKSRVVPALAAVLALAAVGLGAWQLLGPRTAPAPATVVPPTEVAVVEAKPATLPAVEPAPPLPPAQKKLVHVLLATLPKGARIVRLDTEQTIGVTPASLELPFSETPLVVELRKNGFEREALNLVLTNNATVKLALKKKRRAIDKGGLVDPFDQ